ncbi:MAG: rod shape-determining protein RodA, partial [Fuscovulum sp.]|nr:rod shape-determining protein RodA [Fuscovulum sp.]
MSFLESRIKRAPTGLRKVLYLNWPLIVLVTAVAAVGVLMLWSIAGGDFDIWARRQAQVFGAGLAVMFAIAMVPAWFWRNMAGVAYIVSFVLLLFVEFKGRIGMGAQRWIDLGPIDLQPSEMMKFALVMLLASYYDWLDTKKVSRPLWVLAPVALVVAPTVLVLMQPNLGTSLMLILGGASVMFAAGVSLWYFGAVASLGIGAVAGVFLTRGTPWQFLHDYQYRRIDTFLDPSADPLGAGYNILQAKIALGSGGWSGKGFMQGTQSRLNFLPEKHTDFIFTTLAEEFGFVGAFSLLVLYALIIGFCLVSALQNRDRFSSLLI